jgi:hypothetical protein
MSLKIFASHSWQDAHLVQELRRMLDGSDLSYEITSVESSNPINFPNEIAESKLALDAINRSIRELELRLEALVKEKGKLERKKRVLLNPQLLAKDQRTEAILERFRLRNLSDDNATAAAEHTDSTDTPNAEPTHSKRLEEIELALTLNNKMREDVSRRLSYLNSNRVLLARADIESGSSNVDFRDLAGKFGKGGFSEMHPSLRDLPKALLTTLTTRIAESDVFIIIFSENYFFSVWSHLEVDICYKVGIPSICVDASADASASRYLKLTDRYISWNRNAIVDAISSLRNRTYRSEHRRQS